MSQPFSGFTAATKLYAANHEVVQQIKRMYDDNLFAFADAVRARMQSMAGPDKIGFEPKPGWCSWWIEPADDPTGGEDAASVWYRPLAPTIVSGGYIDLVAEYGGEHKAIRQAYVAAGPPDPLPDHCRLSSDKLGAIEFFRIRIQLGVADPVDAVTGPAMLILRRLREAERAVERLP